MTQKRKRRAGVEDRWTKTVRDEHGNAKMMPSAKAGKGLRWRARYVDDQGLEREKNFGRKTDAQQWLNKQVSDQVTGTWTDPALSAVTFGTIAEKWFGTKAHRSAKTVAAQRIRVRRSVTYVRKIGLVEGPTKNHTSRTVPVPAFVAKLLETEIAGRGGDALVFPSARKTDYLTLGQARYAFQKAAAAVDGCEGARLHDLRHTCASLAIRSGANVKVVQKLLGHKTATLTLDRYGHLYPDDLDAVATAFDVAAQSAAGSLRAVTPFTPKVRDRNGP